MARETEVRLRDQRKPGHGWYDNEIYDVFGDELGQHGISVYLTLTRVCYGTKVQMSLRELAACARMSKDTFARYLKRVIALGLVIEQKSPTPKVAGVYELADVKELAQKYLRNGLEAEKVKSVSPRDSLPLPTLVELLTSATKYDANSSTEDVAICLPVRQMDAQPAPGVFETDLSQNDPRFETDLSHPEDTFNKTQDLRLKTNTHPPTPFASEGENSPSVSEVRDGPAKLPTVSAGMKLAVGCLHGALRVMRACGATDNPRLQNVIEDALELHCSKARCTPSEATELAVKNVKTYLESRRYLAYAWGWRRFFAEGYWANPGSWNFDREALREIKRSSIGMRQ